MVGTASGTTISLLEIIIESHTTNIHLGNDNDLDLRRAKRKEKEKDGKKVEE